MKKELILGVAAAALLSSTAFASFSDVTSDDWYYEAVNYVSENQILNGMGDGTFGVDTTMTRAMIAQVFYNMEGQPTSEIENIFTDVEAGQWYEKAIVWANENGLVSGMGDGTFAPNSLITKEQMVTMLHNYAKYMEYDVSVGEDTNILSYDDILEGKASEWAIPALQWACGAGILNPDGTETMLLPKKELNRAEVASIMQLFCKAYREENTTENTTVEGNVIKLEGNATTGYRWTASSFDEEIISITDNYSVENEDPMLVGQPGVFEFTVTGLKEGTTELVFEYSRSWEENSTVNLAMYTVTVDADKNVTIEENGFAGSESLDTEVKEVTENLETENEEETENLETENEEETESLETENEEETESLETENEEVTENLETEDEE